MSLRQGYESDPPKVDALGTSEKERASREENEKAKNPSEGAGLQKSWDALMKAIDTREDEQVEGYKDDIDTLLVFRFSRIKNCPNLYELKGLRWLVQETQDIPSMIPHLKNVLAELPGHLVMPTVFDDWGAPSESSLDSALKHPTSYHHEDHLFDDYAPAHITSLTSQILCFHHFLATKDNWYSSDVNAVKGLWDHICTVPGNSKLMEVFFWPETLFMQKSVHWHGGILDLYEANWSSLEVTSQIRLVKRFSNSMLPFLEAQREDVRSLFAASRSGLKFFTFLHNEMVTTLYKETSGSDDERWMRMFGHVQSIHQLPPGHHKPLPGFFPIGFQGIVNDSATSEEVLRPSLDSYRQAWPTAWHPNKSSLVKEITTSINTTVPHIQGDPGSTSSFKELQQPLPLHSPLITSQTGLEFLTFVNDKLNEEAIWFGEDTLQDWVDALERVQMFCGLKSDYFKAVPKYDLDLNQVGFYAPKCNPEDNQVEASEVQQPSGDTIILDGQRVGLEAGPSHTQEETQDGVDGSEKEAFETCLSEEVNVKETDKGIGSGALGDCQDRTQDENRVVGGPGADNNV
ncbi:hypothetical protein L218DRAFT_1017764 [Marasmius fiardii PR-910]|nr:hypothetical protein L218DRAFT_1017764 [Marasmius fiardii PR-910]